MSHILNKKTFFFIIPLFIAGLAFAFFSVLAAPDSELTYHGKLTDTLGISVPNGNYDFTITIYDSVTGGTSLWSETKTLAVTSGIFSTTLGDTTALNLDFADNYWLEIQIDSNPAMTPRRKVTPTGFALNSHRLNGLTADNYIDTGAVAQTKTGALAVNDDFTVNTNDLFVDVSAGRVGIGTNNPQQLLHVAGEGAFGDSVTASNSERALNLVSTDAVMRVMRISPDIDTQAPSVELIHRTTPDGPNTQSWDFVVNSNGFSIRDRGLPDIERLTVAEVTGFVGIGNTSPAERLTVSGAINLGNTTNTNEGTIRYSGTDFEGYDGSSWSSLTSGGSDSDWTVNGTNLDIGVTGAVRANAGTVSQPAYAGSNSATGIYFPTAVQMGFSLGGSDYMTLASSGINMGTSLSVSGSASFTSTATADEMRVNAGSTGQTAYGLAANQATGMYFPSITQIGLVTAGINRMTISNSGVAFEGSLLDINDQTGTAGQILSSTGAGIDWIDAPAANTDTLASLSCGLGQVAQWNGSVWVCVTPSSGTTTFTGLSDTPANYTGAASYLTRVNAGGTAVEFFDASGWDQNVADDVTAFTGLSDTPNAYDAGSILFTSGTAVTEDNDNFFWDDGNDRLGIGTDTPSSMLEIFGVNNELKLSYDLTNYADLAVNNAGELTISASSAAESAVVIGSGASQDTSVQFDGAVHDFFAGIDNATGAYSVGTGTDVSGSATITGVGTVSNSAGGTAVTGSGTAFLSTFRIGNAVTIGSDTVTVTAIASDTSMITTAITSAHSGATYAYSGGTKFAVESSGNVGIGISDPLYALDVRTTGSSAVIARFNNASTNTSCTLTASGGTINCSSDERLKKNIAPLDDGLDTLMQLHPTEYNWKYEDDEIAKTIGFIAQDVQSVLPGLVREDEESGYLQLSTIGMIPLITQAVQEQNLLITTNIDGLTRKAESSVINEGFENFSGDIAELEDDMLTLQVKANKLAGNLDAVNIRLDAIDAGLSILQLLGATDLTALENLLAVDPDTLLYTETDGELLLSELSVTGKITAEEVETSKLTIAGDNETIGVAIICPAEHTLDDGECIEDEDADNDGKSVSIKSEIITTDTTIFTTFENNPGTVSWVEKTKDDDEFDGFVINLDDNVTEVVKVHWWMVDKMVE